MQYVPIRRHGRQHVCREVSGGSAGSPARSPWPPTSSRATFLAIIVPSSEQQLSPQAARPHITNHSHEHVNAPPTARSLRVLACRIEEHRAQRIRTTHTLSRFVFTELGAPSAAITPCLLYHRHLGKYKVSNFFPLHSIYSIRQYTYNIKRTA